MELKDTDIYGVSNMYLLVFCRLKGCTASDRANLH